MKTNFLNENRKLTALWGVIFSLLLVGFTSKPSTNNMINIKGTISNSEEKLKESKIKVYEFGKLIKTIKSENGKFDFILNSNTELMLEFTSKGHHSKRIAFDTNVNPGTIPPLFKIKILLLDKDFVKNNENAQELLDLPVAFIKYDSKKQRYIDKNKEYSRLISQELENELAQGFKRD